MPKKCKKKNHFRHKSQAVEFIRSIPLTSAVVPTRVYWCGQHKTYHYTSKVR